LFRSENLGIQGTSALLEDHEESQLYDGGRMNFMEGKVSGRFGSAILIITVLYFGWQIFFRGL